MNIMEGITNKYIESVLNPVCNNFIGVFSSDTLPTNLKKEHFSLVCNLSKAEAIGSHFITIIGQSGKVLYLDSFGLPCIVKEIQRFLKMLNQPILQNAKQIQDIESKMCGFYCILFCMYYDKLKFNFQLAFDDSKLLINDKLCVKYIKQLLK